MCGISGIYYLDNKGKLDPRLLLEMNQRIRHRGPDDEGFLLIDTASGKAKGYSGAESQEAVKRKYAPFEGAESACLGMGFRRLSTLELSEAGHQPMSDPELGLHLTFNGEIYNHVELRAELETAGYTFRGHSDTEVILKAYHHWGEAAISRFNGMWAFVIWDDNRKQLFCSRDRYGIKPFYYATAQGQLFWGSEMKQLLVVPIDKSLNEAMIWRSMKINSLLVYDDQTFWGQIKTLKPGHNLIVKDGELKISEYYALDIDSFETSQLSLDEAVEAYRALFIDSLHLQMRSDVEIGASLSGGMDSSAIVSCAHTCSGRSMQTFSSYYEDDPAMDERKWIKLIVEQSASRAHYISPHACDAADWFEDVTWFNDIPTRAGFTSQWAVCHLAQQQGIKVLLSGQGSDELFAGYKHSAYRYFADMIRGGQLSKLGFGLKGYLEGKSVPSALSGMGKILLSALLPESKLYELEFKHYRFEPFNKAFTDSALQNAGEPILDRIQDIKASRLANFLFNMLHTTSIQTLLHLEDRMSSAASIEGRVPFLDHRLVDFAFRMPADYKIKAPMHKYLHRLAMKDVVPREIYERKDKGIFSSPFYTLWMRGELKPFFTQILESSQFRKRGIWNLPEINSRWKKYLAGDPAPAEMLFNTVALELWYRKFVD